MCIMGWIRRVFKCSYVLGWFAENVSDSSSVPQSVVQHGDDAHQQSVAGSLRVRLLWNTHTHTHTHTHGQCCSSDMRCNSTWDFIDLVDHRPPALTHPPAQPQRWSLRCSWLRLKNTTSWSPERLRSAAELNNTTHQSYWDQFNPSKHTLPDVNCGGEDTFSLHLQHTLWKLTHTSALICKKIQWNWGKNSWCCTEGENCFWLKMFRIIKFLLQKTNVYLGLTHKHFPFNFPSSVSHTGKTKQFPPLKNLWNKLKIQQILNIPPVKKHYLAWHILITILLNNLMVLFSLQTWKTKST